MKSLEHLIRLVHEGKAEKGEKSSLEHAIRKIRETKLDDIESTKATRAGRFDTKMTESDLNYMGSGTGGEPKMHAEDGKKKKTYESIGVGGSDDPVGNQFKSIRTATPHIKPPAGPGSHSQAPENAARQRTLAKERTSMTMHGKVNEETKKRKSQEDDHGKGKVEVAPSQKEIEKLLGVGEKPTETPPPKPEAPGAPPKPEAPTPKPETPGTPTTPKPTETLGSGPSSAAIAAGGVLGGLAGLGGIPVSTSIPVSHKEAQWTTRPIAHKARKHKVYEESERKEIENVPRKGDRKSIAYVGRSEDDPKTAKEKTSRQAAYKINVIDENRKLAGIVLSTVKDKKQQIKAKTEDGLGQSSKNIQYPNGTIVSINPELSRTTMDIDGKMPNDYK